MRGGGGFYMALPSEEIKNFTSGRNGCLNFYDDCTHQKVPDWKKINSILNENHMDIIFKVKNNQPYLLHKIGMLNEEKSAELKTVLAGTWELYGFESIIWAKKDRNN